MKTNVDLEREINANEPYTELVGDYKLNLSGAQGFFAGGVFIRNLVTVNTGNKTVDGSAARITVKIDADPRGGLAVFNLLKSVGGLTLRNININIKYSGAASDSTVYTVRNNSQGLTVSDSRFGFSADNQINHTAIFNDGALDTHLTTPADNLTVFGNRINAYCRVEEITKDCTLCGIDNTLANSISISNNYIFVQNKGLGKGQLAIGIRNTGRFTRIENNNIKANGSHSEGSSLEEAHTYGTHNSGLYMVFTGNNCVSEWGGKCVGLYNSGAYANITGNKILSTHTIMGRSVILDGGHNLLNNNIITSTSRNPRFVEVSGSFNTVNGNHIQGLMGFQEYRSGCGIFVRGNSKEKVSRCVIKDNVVLCVKDFGIVLINGTRKNLIVSNQFVKHKDAENYCGIYAENSEDTIKDNITDGKTSLNTGIGRDILKNNYDGAVCSI